MDWKWLFFSFEGRIPRKLFWMGMIVMIVFSVLVAFAVSSIMGVNLFALALMGDKIDAMSALSSRMGWVSLVVYLIMCWPAYALCVKRCHDRGTSGIVVVLSIGLGILNNLLQAFGLNYDVVEIGNVEALTPNAASIALGTVIGLVSLYLLVVLGFLKGNKGDNKYGPDPLAATD